MQVYQANTGTKRKPSSQIKHKFKAIQIPRDSIA